MRAKGGAYGQKAVHMGKRRRIWTKGQKAVHVGQNLLPVFDSTHFIAMVTPVDVLDARLFCSSIRFYPL